MAGVVAALYVDPKGVYANLPGVEVWDEARDARTYAGPYPVDASRLRSKRSGHSAAF